jgi:hypothetical protein
VSDGSGIQGFFLAVELLGRNVLYLARRAGSRLDAPTTGALLPNLLAIHGALVLGRRASAEERAAEERAAQEPHQQPGDGRPRARAVTFAAPGAPRSEHHPTAPQPPQGSDGGFVIL